MTSLLDARGVAVPGRLAPLDLRMKAGERVALIGPNGSGKTSLLRALAGIAGSGEVDVDGTSLAPVSPAQRRCLLAYLPASREVAWPIPARGVIALGLDRPDPARVEEVLGELGLEPFAERPIDSLSTGERARVLLGRALAPRPRLLLLDEPLSNLDPAWALRIIGLLGEAANKGATVLVALHDLSLATAFDRLLMLDEGALIADGQPADILSSAAFGKVFGVEPAGPGWRLRRPADPRSSR